MQAASWVNHFLVDYIQTSGQNFGKKKDGDFPGHLEIKSDTLLILLY